MPIDWVITDELISYPDALNAMNKRVDDIISSNKPEAIWLLEHPPLFTAGTSARSEDLLAPQQFDVFETGRGGQYTYHGPGQRVIYVMLDLRQRGQDIRKFITQLEDWIKATLDELAITAKTYPDRVGLWVDSQNANQYGESKISAIGIRLKKWVSFHGVSINIDPDLSHFQGIVPCGIFNHGVTSLSELGHIISMPEVDMILQRKFNEIFGDTRRIEFTEL